QAAIDTFIRRAGPRTTAFETRRILGLAGRGLMLADAEVLADFAIAGADYVYDDFFKCFADSTLAEVSQAILTRPGGTAEDRRQYSGVIATARSGYRGPLSKAVGIVVFAEAVNPKPIPMADLIPAEADGIEIWTGAAELLRLKGFIAEGPQLEKAIETYGRAISKWPTDGILLAGLVSLYVEYEDRYPDELGKAIELAHRHDADNAAYAYLVATREFRSGQDEAALANLRSVAGRKLCTFYPIERAKRVVASLERVGYGKTRARLTAYRSMSLAPYFDLKDLANRTILRSTEYEVEKRVKALNTVLEFPRVFSSQISAGPRVHHVERIRVKVLATGLSRYANWIVKSDRDAAEAMRREAVQAEVRTKEIERGEDLAAGRYAWTTLFDILGEDDFLLYCDRVLLGNEAEFLIKCSDKKGLEEVVGLATAEYPF
ncbi:MAG: hypothetical protein ABFS86_12605, partial [Planctomycetota bacterium]